ncbi:Arb2 domain-containing protein [Neurospora tetraspora]|uniref:Arb2 domain-containing protein n=1 Tax=Neurospora tetraspora TaxID=94610 RepID=A0AAE0MW92_9PEZI|nr:Arb2 domain-containing protein [Neurospora tetraspora]
MFRRRWSGLPAEPKFTPDLKELGYFINEEDEVRYWQDPDFYFKYFSTKNVRYNDCQRFAFNEVVKQIIDSRLEAEGLKKALLPLGVASEDERHVKIRLSEDLSTKSRVVIIFGQSGQDFGILAHRVASGLGGLNKGSMMNMVKALKQQKSSATDDAAPGIILANPGNLWWWPEGKKGLSEFARHQIPGSSLVHWGWHHDPERNTIPENANPTEHVKYIFEKVVPQFVSEKAKIDVIALGDMADEVEQYLDNDDVWAKIGHRLNALVVLGGFYDMREANCQGFKKFVDQRGRAYIMNQDPLDTLIAGPDGGSRAVTGYVGYGCPTYSVGPDAFIMELVLIEAGSAVLKWLQEVAMDKDYVNERVHIFPEEEEDDGKWPGWDKDDDESKEETEELKEKHKEDGDKRDDDEQVAKKVKVRVQRDVQPPSKDEPEGIDEELAKEMSKRERMADGNADSEEEI